MSVEASRMGGGAEESTQDNSHFTHKNILKSHVKSMEIVMRLHIHTETYLDTHTHRSFYIVIRK